MAMDNLIMETRGDFQRRIRSVLEEFGSEVLAYDKSEFWMIQAAYEYIEFYAVERRLTNTAIALPLARGLHNGIHRKSSIIRDGKSYRLPYLIHPLLVCRMLVDLQLPISADEEDIVLAAALCHDMIEDLPFEEHGLEMTKLYHLDPLVYETVKKVSKRKDFTELEERRHFQTIQEDRKALLVKLSDRGNNVEDLYNMSVWKVHEYVGETEKFFIPMCRYAKTAYPDLEQCFTILEDKIMVLTESAQILVDRYEEKEQELRVKLGVLRDENLRLREEWKKLWKE